MPERLCRTCAWYRQRDATCQHDASGKVLHDPVEGSVRIYDPCRVMRFVDGRCGRAGVLWTPRPPSPWTQLLAWLGITTREDT